MISRYEHFFLAPTALIIQVMTAAYTYFAPDSVFGPMGTFPEMWLWPLSVTLFASSGLCGLYLTSKASYLLLIRSAYPLATVVILLFCLPAWLLSLFHIHAALVLLALI